LIAESFEKSNGTDYSASKLQQLVFEKKNKASIEIPNKELDPVKSQQLTVQNNNAPQIQMPIKELDKK